MSVTESIKHKAATDSMLLVTPLYIFAFGVAEIRPLLSKQKYAKNETGKNTLRKVLQNQNNPVVDLHSHCGVNEHHNKTQVQSVLQEFHLMANWFRSQEKAAHGSPSVWRPQKSTATRLVHSWSSLRIHQFSYLQRVYAALATCFEIRWLAASPYRNTHCIANSEPCDLASVESMTLLHRLVYDHMWVPWKDG